MSRPDPVFVRALAAVRAALDDIALRDNALRDTAPCDTALRETAPRRVLLAVSGGADSLALASVAAVLHGRGDIDALAAIVDHGLQEGSAEAARTAAEQCRAMGLPAEVRRVRVDQARIAEEGLEAAARAARYEALGGFGLPVLTAHTLSDQAEQVLLGLARGSGTRSLAGIRRAVTLECGTEDCGTADCGTADCGTAPRSSVVVVRPFLHPDCGLWREDTEHVCREAGLTPWTDPSNLIPDRPRTDVRINALPALERSFPGIRQNLARTAERAAEDADLLDVEARAAHARITRGAGRLEIAGWRDLHPALQGRVIRIAVGETGAPEPGRERVEAVANLMRPRELGGTDSSGPVEMPGCRAWRRRIAGAGGKMELILVLEPHSPLAGTSPGSDRGAAR